MNCDICKLSKCFWCGGEKEELVLLGPKALAREKKAWCKNNTMSVIISYEPCQKCVEQFTLGIQVIEAQDNPVTAEQPAIVEGVYPTGRFWVIKRDAFNDIPEDQDFVFVKEEAAKEMGLYDADNS